MARPFLLLDLSNNNASVDLTRVAQAGIAGFWHKVSEGSDFADRWFRNRVDRGRLVGMRVGGYHFANARTSDPIPEAMFFYRCLGKIGRRDLAPALDLETNPHNLSPQQLVAWARAFNHEFQRLTGVWPLFYSYPAFIEGMRAEKTIGRGLWLASYSRNDGKEHPYSVPQPFKQALAHQFTSQARLAGVGGTVDLSSAQRLVPILAFGWRGL